MSDTKMTLYDHILMRLVQRRAKHHGFDKPQLTEVKAVRLSGDDHGIQMAEGMDQIPAELMPQIIEAMGFIPWREQHDPACPKQQDEDLRCNCVQPPTQWVAPPRVRKAMGEDYETALAERRAANGEG